MRFDVPEGETAGLVSEAKALLDGPVAERLAGQESGRPRLEEDGRLAAPVRDLKLSMHRLGAEAGLYAPHVSKRLGGRGSTLRASMYLQEEVFRRGLEGQQWVLGWTDGPSPMVELATEQRAVEEFVRPLMRAEITTAFCLTEPQAGSDATAIQTSARRSNGDWILNGHKHLITNAPFWTRLRSSPAHRVGSSACSSSPPQRPASEEDPSSRR